MLAWVVLSIKFGSAGSTSVAFADVPAMGPAVPSGIDEGRKCFFGRSHGRSCRLSSRHLFSIDKEGVGC